MYLSVLTPQLHHPRLRNQNRAALREIIDKIAVVEERPGEDGVVKPRLVLRNRLGKF